MDTDEIVRVLREEIDEITMLIKEWEGDSDPDMVWAIYLLELCRERREQRLKLLLH
jgi:hypothetical protein